MQRKNTIKRTNSIQLDENGKQLVNDPNQNIDDNKMMMSQIIKKPQHQLNNDNSFDVMKHRYEEKVQEQQFGQKIKDNLSNQQIFLQKTKVSQVRPIDSNQIILTQSGKNIVASKIRQSKIPQGVLISIKQNASGKKESRKTNDPIAKSILIRIRTIKNKFVCQICTYQYQEKQKRKIGKCQHVFCDSCLRQYTDYKISRFEQVACPSDSCPETMDLEGAFYKSLSQQLKQKYAKVHIFHKAAKNNQRLCPDEKCKEGVLVIEEGVAPKCNKCGKVYCSQCFFPQHQGACESNEISFFQNNLKFRQCSNCKAVVEKKEGCNHITCRCKYQFCYLCGAKWLNYQHKCGVNTFVQQNCCQCQCQNCDCNCFRQANCECGSCLIKLILKVLLLPLFAFVLCFVIFIVVSGFSIALLVSLTIGMLPYTINFICSLSGVRMVIAIILYPLTMFVGLAKAFHQIFCPVTIEIIEGTVNILSATFRNFFMW